MIERKGEIVEGCNEGEMEGGVEKRRAWCVAVGLGMRDMRWSNGGRTNERGKEGGT